jgi:hypothetical protein
MRDTMIPAAGKCVGAIIDSRVWEHDPVLFLFFPDHTKRFWLCRASVTGQCGQSSNFRTALHPNVSMFAYNRRRVLRKISVVHP